MKTVEEQIKLIKVPGQPWVIGQIVENYPHLLAYPAEVSFFPTIVQGAMGQSRAEIVRLIVFYGLNDLVISSDAKGTFVRVFNLPIQKDEPLVRQYLQNLEKYLKENPWSGGTFND